MDTDNSVVKFWGGGEGRGLEGVNGPKGYSCITFKIKINLKNAQACIFKKPGFLHKLAFSTAHKSSQAEPGLEPVQKAFLPLCCLLCAQE